MKKIKILPLFAVIAISAYIAIVLSSCSGTTGAPGAAGDVGPTGPTGLNGVSNIKLKFVTVSYGLWGPTVGTPNSFFYQYGDGDITDPVNEAVYAYYSLSASGGKYNWQPLPAVNVLGPGDQLGFGWKTDYVTFTYDTLPGTLIKPSTQPSPTIYFNVAVVPPAIMKRHPNTNWKDAREVLNLPEMQAAMQAIKP